MIEVTSVELLAFIGGIFFTGVRSALGKIMVKIAIRLAKFFWLKSEREVAYFLHVRNSHIKRRSKL